MPFEDISEEQLLDIVENRYNRCFVCREKFIVSLPKKLIRIAILSTRQTVGRTTSPWDFLVEENMLEYKGPSWISTTDSVLVHEECFFREAGDDWKF